MHESINFQRLTGIDGRLAAFEKLDYRLDERRVAVITADRVFAGIALGRAAVAFAFAEDADAAVIPFAGHDNFSVLGCPTPPVFSRWGAHTDGFNGPSAPTIFDNNFMFDFRYNVLKDFVDFFI